MPKNKEFDDKKLLLELEHDLYLKKHELKMQELEYHRESDKLHHEREMERQRIKSAEIRKTQERREFRDMRKWQN